MVKLKLNENYANSFLTTYAGIAFFRDWKEQNRPEWVEIDDEKIKSDRELQELIRMKILIKKEEEKNSDSDKKEKKKNSDKKEKTDDDKSIKHKTKNKI